MDTVTQKQGSPSNPYLPSSSPLFIPPTSGYKTTEFWLTMFLNLMSVGTIVIDQTNAPWALVASSIVNAIYATLRGALKHGYTQRASALQKVGGNLAAFLVGCFLLVGSGLLTSCGALAEASINWAGDDFDLRVENVEGVQTYHYLHHPSAREFRATQSGDGWFVETLEPITGLWIGYGDAKGGLNLTPPIPLPPAELASGPLSR